MSIIDNIETLSMKIDDKFFDPKLIDALTLYHSLIQEKKIIPRENQLNTADHSKNYPLIHIIKIFEMP